MCAGVVIGVLFVLGVCGCGQLLAVCCDGWKLIGDVALVCVW